MFLKTSVRLRVWTPKTWQTSSEFFILQWQRWTARDQSLLVKSSDAQELTFWSYLLAVQTRQIVFSIRSETLTLLRNFIHNCVLLSNRANTRQYHRCQPLLSPFYAIIDTFWLIMSKNERKFTESANSITLYVLNSVSNVNHFLSDKTSTEIKTLGSSRTISHIKTSHYCRPNHLFFFHLELIFSFRDRLYVWNHLNFFRSLARTSSSNKVFFGALLSINLLFWYSLRNLTLDLTQINCNRIVSFWFENLYSETLFGE